jgi:hypothetical protein
LTTPMVAATEVVTGWLVHQQHRGAKKHWAIKPAAAKQVLNLL